MNETIGPRSRVSMYFSLALEDGTVADGTEAGEPFVFGMGDGSLVHGLELALLGLRAGDHQVLQIDPRDAFGYPDPANIHVMRRADFPAEMPLEPGMVIGFTTPEGAEVPGSILELEGDQVKVDLNHPLAGHELTFSVEILTVEEPEEESDD